MSRRLDWRRARKWRRVESKYGSGIALPNGHVTPRLPQDDLEQRANRAMRAWERSLSPAERERLAK